MGSTGDEAAWSEVVALHARVEHQLAKVLQRRLGLGLSEYRALSRLAADEQGGLRIQVLAEALGLNESSVSRLAGRLEQDGLTERCVCDDDRRGVYVFITEDGRRRLAEAAPAYRAELAAALDQAAADPALAAAVAALRGLRALGRAGRLRSIADDDLAQYLVDPGHQGVAQPDPGGLHVLPDLLRASGTDDGGRDVRVLQRPGDRELGHGEISLRRQRTELLDGGEHGLVQPPLDETSS